MRCIFALMLRKRLEVRELVGCEIQGICFARLYRQTHCYDSIAGVFKCLQVLGPDP
jgi:hypothetical protein